MNSIKTSVIIPVYNTENYLQDCFESLFLQTQKEIEIIAIDDGSTDNSLQVLRNYEEHYSNVHVYTQRNMRQGAARNKGIEVARGDYIYFLDSDDTIDPETLEICYAYAENYKLDAVLFDAKVFMEEGVPDDFQPDSFDRRNIITEKDKIYTGVNFLECYMEQTPDTVSPCMMYIAKEFINSKKLSFMSHVFYEDEEFRFNLMQKAERIMYIPKLLYNRRYRYNSTMMAEYNEQRNTDLSTVIRRMIEDVEDNTSDTIRRYIEIKLWMLLDRCRISEDNQKTDRLANQIVKIMQKFWDKFDMPNSIEDIKFRVYYVDYLRRIFTNLDWSEELHEVEEARVSLMKKIPLNDPFMQIGIYGREDFIERLFWGYQNCCGEVRADIKRIVRKKETSKGNEIELEDIKNERLNYILLISGDDQKNVAKYLKDSLPEKIRIIFLGDEKGNFLF